MNRMILTLAKVLLMPIILLAQAQQPAPEGQAQGQQARPKRRTPSMSTEGGRAPEQAASEDDDETDGETGGEAPKIKVGSLMKLGRRGVELMPVADSSIDFRILIRARMRGDTKTMLNLLETKSVVMVPNMVDVRVLQTRTETIDGYEFNACEIRVLEGEAKGVTGWVSGKWLSELYVVPSQRRP